MPATGAPGAVSLERPPATRRHIGGTSATPWPAGWPLVLLFGAYPVWWLLGLGDFIFLIMAVPMAVAVVRRGDVSLPRGTVLWFVFLLVVLVSALTLPAVAPTAEAGGLGGRLLTYGYRLAWYLAVTIGYLYVCGSSNRELPLSRLVRLLAFMFVVTASGGLLGVLAPGFEVTSLVEWLLPVGLASHPFMSSLVHPAAADVQSVLGYAQARPRAPFAYANAWGANLSFYLPFFLYSWVWRGRTWQRAASVPVLAGAAIGVVYSLNRGLWVVLLLGAAYGTVHAVRVRGPQVLLWVAPLVVSGLVALALSPLTGIVSDRLESPHSNDRRAELALDTVMSTLKGSPVVGFGNTRDVQGAFSSIAGGATAACPACGVPPLGTQGHLWLVLFSQGVAGIVLFLVFLLVRLRRHATSRRPLVLVASVVVVFSLFESLIYDLLGPPLFTLMVALAIMWRAEREGEGSDWTPDAGDASLLGPRGGGRRVSHRGQGSAADEVRLSYYAAQTRRLLPLTLVGALVGLLVGGAWVALQRPTSTARSAVLVADIPLLLPDPANPSPRRFSMDTEAERVRSKDVVEPVAAATGEHDAVERLSVTAVPTTKVLLIAYRSNDRDKAVTGAQAAAGAYLRVRREALLARREARVDTIQQALITLRDRLDELSSAAASDPNADDRARRDALEQQLLGKQADARRAAVAAVWPGEVVRRSALSTTGGRTNPTVPPASGLALGAAVGAVVGLGRGHRLLTRSDVAGAVPGAPVAAVRHGEYVQLSAVWTALLAPPVHRPRRIAVVPSTSDTDAGPVTTGLVDVRPASGGAVLVVQTPDSGTADGLDAAVATDVVVLAVRRGARRRELVATRERLLAAGARLGGVVLVDERPRRWRRRHTRSQAGPYEPARPPTVPALASTRPGTARTPLAARERP